MLTPREYLEAAELLAAQSEAGSVPIKSAIQATLAQAYATMAVAAATLVGGPK